ncbi:MAG: T9SS C-terminal target domain-containing protein, partial [Calditrichaeota bacterium]
KKYNPSGQVQWQSTEGLSRVTNDHFLANTYNAQGETFLLSESAGDPVVTKFADDGTQLWQAIHSVGEPSYIVHKNIALNSKGEVYTLLTEGTDAGNFEDYLLRFSSRGTSSEKYPLTDLILWRSGQGIVIDENDAIYVMGSTKSNDLFYPALAKYDAQGNEIWRYVKSTDVGKWPEFILIELDPSNNLILLGRITEDSGLVSSNTVLTIEKLSKSGQVLWQKKWENPGKGTDYIQGLQTDHDGNIFFAVNSYFNYMEGNPVYYTAGIVKFSPGGKKLWDYLDQYDQNGEERLFGFSVDVFGNALFATANGSITKLNKDGDPVFRRDRTGLTEFQYFRLLNFEVDENANIYYNGFLYQLNETTYYGTKLSEGFTCLRPDGEVYWQNEGELSFGSFFINRIEQPNSLYNISTKGEYSARHIRLQKYDLGSDSTVVVTGDKVLLKAYPNPIRNATIIEYDLPQPAQVKVAVYDVLGRHVSTITNGAKEAGTHSEFWYPGGTADGNYFIVLKAGGKKAVCKVTYLK